MSVADPKHDPVTGEIVEDTPTSLTRAANGEVLAPPSRSAGTVLDLLEDGDFSAEAYEQIKELAAKIRDISESTGNKAKGKAILTLDLEYEGEAFKIRGDVKVKAPELPRRRSITWLNDQGDFTRFPPNQAQLFGGRKPRVVS